MVTAGNTMTLSDLTALAAIANGKTSLSFEPTPPYIENFWTEYSGVTILNTGSGYLVGNIFSIPNDGNTGIANKSEYQVCSVDGIGGVTGIRTIYNGQLFTNLGANPATSPTASVGGNGTGCLLQFSTGDIAQPQAYDFSDWDIKHGTVNALYIVNGGYGFTVGDSWYLNELSASGTVSSVFKGSITGLTIASSGSINNYFSVRDNISNMNLTASSGTGSNAIVGGLYSLSKNSAWLSELSRMSNDAYTSLTNTNNNFTLSPNVSGPYPAGFGSGFGDGWTTGTGNTPKINAYYASNSPTASAFLLQTAIVKCAIDSNSGNSTNCSFEVAGEGTLACMFSLNDEINVPSDYTLTGDVPGTGWAYQQFATDGGGNPVYMWCSLFSGSVSAGKNNVSVTYTPSNSHDTSAHSPTQIWMSANLMLSGSVWNGFIVNENHFRYTGKWDEGSTAWAGIHDTLQVNKMPVMSVDTGSNSGNFGVFPNESGYALGNGYNLTFDTTPVYCTYLTPPIVNLNPIPLSAMPWNLPRTKNPNNNYHSGSFVENPMLLGNLAPINNVKSNGYNQSVIVENQLEPMGWAANSYFPVGQQIYVPYGNYQVCSGAGKSGTSMPSFSSTVGSTTTDGNAIWKCHINQLSASTYVLGHNWNVGQKIVDANGNTQTAISNWVSNHGYVSGSVITDYNNNWQICSSTGTSSIIAPTWATTGSTVDGGATWQFGVANAGMGGSTVIVPTWNTKYNGLTQDAAAVWQLTNPFIHYPMAQVTHSAMGLSSYPTIWASETLSSSMLPTGNDESHLTIFGTGNQWNTNGYQDGSGNSKTDIGFHKDNLAAGSFIYSIRFDRVGTPLSGSNLTLNTSGEISYDIGCMRNGSYSSFSAYLGSFNTGQTYQVMIPIFNTSPLYYSCGERLNPQVLTCGYGGSVAVTNGSSTFSYPVLASYLNDIQAMLAGIT